MMIHRLPFFAASILCMSVLTGCGREAPPQTVENPPAENDGKSSREEGGTDQKLPPTASILTNGQTSETETSAAADDAESGDSKFVPPEKDTAEWAVHQITQLRLQPFPETNDLDKLRAARQERNRKIIDLAQQAIAQTHKDDGKTQLFDVAVHHLLNARLQLALQDDKQAIENLYSDAAALYQRDPDSRAAAEGAYTLVRLAHANARRYAGSEPRWLQEFARQARLFASNFPRDEKRAVPLLFSAGRSCELHGMPKEAVLCFQQIPQKFPDNRFTPQASAILRRLNLEGRPIQLAGPTIDGGFLSIDDLQGQLVLVILWATDAQPFIEQLATIKNVTAKLSDQGVAVIGVNLDEDEPDVDAFLEKHSLDWKQIFFADREKRGWNNPIAGYYGVRDIPTMFLVDRDGTVLKVARQISGIQPTLSRLVKPKEVDNTSEETRSDTAEEEK